MEMARTPLGKQRYLNAAIKAIRYSYSLSFPGREAEKEADEEFRIMALLMVLFQAQLKYPVSSYNYMEYLGYKIGKFGEDEYRRVTFYSSICVLMDLDTGSLKVPGEAPSES